MKNTETIKFLEEDGYFVAQSVNCPGVVVQAKTLKELKTKTRKMYDEWLDMLKAADLEFVQVSADDPVGEEYVMIRDRKPL